VWCMAAPMGESAIVRRRVGVSTAASMDHKGSRELFFTSSITA